MEEFINYWPALIKNIRHTNNYNDIPKSISSLIQVLDKNVPLGKQTRAKLFLETFLGLKPNATIEEREVAYIVGWCIEIMQAAYLIADDIMDGSKTRRSRPCWYLQVGPMALIDVLLLENLVYELLQETTMLKKDKGKLLDLILLFQRTSYRTLLGQILDIKIGLEKNIDEFNYETYGAIVKYKTSIYTFYQPVAAGMILAGGIDDATLCTTEKFACQIGYLFQVQDDYIDCFGDPKISGKIGTDIQEGKCTWLALKAMEMMDDKQIKTFRDNYGLSNEENSQKIKNLYNELGLDQVYKKFERNTFIKLRKALKTRDQSKFVVNKVFACILDKVYKRTH